MTTVGLVGSEQLGGARARLGVDAGYHVILSNSRGPETLEDVVAALGPRASASTSREAATAGAVVVGRRP